LITSPAYMLAQSILEAEKGISRSIHKLTSLL